MAVTLHQFDYIEDYFSDAVSRAMNLQANLVKEQKKGLTIALASIFLLATSAYLLHTASLQVLCLVAVFLMIQYLDRLRKSQTTFHFVSSRLAAETLRVMGAVRSNPLLLDLMVSTRSLSTQPVAEESARACDFIDVLPSPNLSSPETKPKQGDAFWHNWLEDQTNYYLKASKREIARSKKGITTFNLAFTLVALIGLGTSIWGGLIRPHLDQMDFVRLWRLRL